MCLVTVRQVESALKGRCECCHGAKSPKRLSWYCAKCDRRIASGIRKSVKLWARKNAKAAR